MATIPLLWKRIEAVEFDRLDATFPFSARLARDNGWTSDFAKRVVEEYRRFCYLACTANHPVTPSDHVDQAWHLHLTYTRHYWGEFRDALGRDLHHGPTKGGQAEDDRFEQQYEATLASYRAEFGEEPPSGIWPEATIRFGDAADLRWVNTRRNWVIPKPKRALQAASIAVLAAASLVSLWVFSVHDVLAQSSSDANNSDPRSLNDPMFTFLVVALVFAAYMLFRYYKSRIKKSRKKGGKNNSDGFWGGGCGAGCQSSGCGGGGCGSG